MDSTQSISFRRLANSDLPLMHRWLTSGEVRRWYARHDMSFEEVRQHFAGTISGGRPTHSYLILLDQKPVGYVQTYRIRDYPAYFTRVRCEREAAGLDIFIGEPTARGQGLGPTAIRLFLAEVVFGETLATCCYVGPDPVNGKAIRAYEKAGFVYVRTIPASDDDTDEYLMRIDRADILPET